MDDLEVVVSKIEAEKMQAEAMLASIGEGVVATDSQGNIIIMNASAAEMLHCDAETAIGKKFFDVWDMEDSSGRTISASELPIHIALTSAKNMRIFTNYYVRKDKTKFPVALTVTPTIINGKVVGAIAVFRDRTVENEIDKARSEFVSLASHQLRTPLGITKWYLEALKEEGYLENVPGTARSYLNEVYRSNERVISVVNDLLSASRIDHGRIRNHPEPTDITQIVRDAVDEMKVLAAQKNIGLELMITRTNLPKINIDALRLREVVSNLIANALNYTSQGKVTVRVNKKPAAILISVKDTGMGISAEDQHRLFTKFFRSERSAAYDTKGSGLGLYIVKSYVEAWGGSVTVESEIDVGSTFTITLPFNVRSEERRHTR
jgi:PAS domain S-box-containing protein